MIFIYIFWIKKPANYCDWKNVKIKTSFGYKSKICQLATSQCYAERSRGALNLDSILPLFKCAVLYLWGQVSWEFAGLSDLLHTSPQEWGVSRRSYCGSTVLRQKHLYSLGTDLVRFWHPGHLQPPSGLVSSRWDLTHFLIQWMWKTWKLTIIFTVRILGKNLSHGFF